MEDRLRIVLLRIACGLPIGVAAAATLGVAPTLLACGCPPAVQEPYTEVIAGTSSGGESETSCEERCRAQIGRYPDSCEVTEGGDTLCHTTRATRNCIAGRLPHGAILRDRGDVEPSAATWLRAMAALERAAVPAFVELATNLRAHGAPSRLGQRARGAAKDEARHARLVSSLVRRDEARGPEVVLADASVPSLESLARHNAEEGCVREAWGALVAAHQAARAVDTRVRAVMTSIARDEARHALLSLDVHAGARPRLAAPARERVERARRTATEALRAELCHLEPHAVLGLPDARESLRLSAAIAGAA